MRNPSTLPGAAPCAFEVFRAAMLPKGLPGAEVAQFEALALSRSVERGGTILTSEHGDALVFLASGAAKLVAYASHGREQVVAFHFAGDLIAMPTPREHAYVLLALRASDALIFPVASFLDFAGDHPALMRTIVRSAYKSLHRSREKAVVIGRKTARERVASFLISMAERIGRPKDNFCVLLLPMSRRDIADSLGLTIETISRQLGDLRDEGLIETAGRSTVRLLDLVNLAGCAGHLSRQSSRV